MTVLMKANDQWMRRPADERFKSLGDLHAAALADRTKAMITEPVRLNDLAVVPEGNSLALVGPTGRKAAFTNWSFGQLCSAAGVPSSFMPTLKPTTAATVINERLAAIAKDEGYKSRLLLKNTDKVATLRAISGGKMVEDAKTRKEEFRDSYSRIWNSDITPRLIELESDGRFQPAPAAFDGSRGLYLGDRDMFAFMVDSDRRIFEKAPGGGLSRGFFVGNSEVGASSFFVQTFLYEYVCGNHRVWGASAIKEIRIRHVGDASKKAFGKLAVQLISYANASAADDEAKITACQNHILGATKDEVLDGLFGLRGLGVSLKTLTAGYELAEKRVDWYGNPRSAWGMAGALTEIARDLPNADERTKLEQASSKVMEIAF